MSKKQTTGPNENENKLVFDKINYQLILGGIGVIALGFIIMMMETGEYGIGFLGLTLAPIVIVLGFILEFVAILYTPKKKDGAH